MVFFPDVKTITFVVSATSVHFLLIQIESNNYAKLNFNRDKWLQMKSFRPDVSFFFISKISEIFDMVLMAFK